MKKLAMVAAVILLISTLVFAHEGAISLYLDETIGDCDESIGAFGIVDINLYYVKDQGLELGRSYEFRLVATNGTAIYNQPVWPPTFQASIGDLVNGISVAHSVCIGSGETVTWLGTIPVFNVGADTDTFQVRVVDNPNSKPGPGDPIPGIYITLCDENQTMVQVIGGTFIFNGECNPAVETKSWGAIKSLIKR
ncbi:MAG: hypothetical protein JSV33_16200 [bacterium]|nr:MAG: hypothetical protein JSV33_16200 [bacterium]